MTKSERLKALGFGIYEDMIDLEMCDQIVESFKEDDARFDLDIQQAYRNPEYVRGQSLNLSFRDEWKWADQEIFKAFNKSVNELMGTYGLYKSPNLFEDEGYIINEMRTDQSGFDDLTDIGHANFRRVVAGILFLNTTSGGSMHFPIQDLRVYPKKGQILLFPVTFANRYVIFPPIDGEKYTIRTWMRYKIEDQTAYRQDDL